MPKWNVVAWLGGAVMIGLGGWHLVHGVTAFHEWRRWRSADPSLADFFWTELEIEVAFAVGCLFVALVLAAAAHWLPRMRRTDEYA